MHTARTSEWIDEERIAHLLAKKKPVDSREVRDVLAKALERNGLAPQEVATLAAVEDPDLQEAIFHAAARVKHEIYGPRMELFAPLYISNLCNNGCLYCANRADNDYIERRCLSREEIAFETAALIRQGHKRILLVAGETYPGQGIDYVIDAIGTVYTTSVGTREIRRVNANLAPLPLESFKLLKSTGIGTYQLFQETYHRQTYRKVHPTGLKRNYDWRVTAFDRALQAGIDDIGMGVLFGLADWKFEILALTQHVAHLEAEFGIGCRSISVPRLEPEPDTEMACRPPCPVSDQDLKKIVAILRLAVPYTGIILSTRESAALRREVVPVGVSQMSAGSCLNPGGFPEGWEDEAGRCHAGDQRSLDELVRELSATGHVPSFCTACHRTRRAGKDFMDMARPGLLKRKCAPNALATLEEYLLDHASPETRTVGQTLIDREIQGFDDKIHQTCEAMLAKIRSGRRDVFC